MDEQTSTVYRVQFWQADELCWWASSLSPEFPTMAAATQWAEINATERQEEEARPYRLIRIDRTALYPTEVSE